MLSVFRVFLFLSFLAILGCTSNYSKDDRVSEILGETYITKNKNVLVYSSCPGWSSKLMLMPYDYFGSCRGEKHKEIPKGQEVMVSRVLGVKNFGYSCWRVQIRLLNDTELDKTDIDIPACGLWHPSSWVLGAKTPYEVHKEYLKMNEEYLSPRFHITH